MISNNLKLIATVSLDFYTNNIKTINVKQYDTNTRFIHVFFTEHGKKVALDKSTMSVIARYKKPDGKFGLRDVEILDDGSVLIELDEQMTVVSGKTQLDVMILEQSGVKADSFADTTSFEEYGVAVLSAMPLNLNVIATPIQGAELESQYDFTALNNSLAATKAAEADMITKNAEWEISEESRNIAENGKFDESGNLIEDGRVQAEKKRLDAETQREISENLRNIAENGEYDASGNLIKDGRAQAEERRDNAEKLRIESEKQRDEAENGKFDKSGNLIEDGRVQAVQKAVDRANTAAQKCEDIVIGTGIIMQSEKGAASGVASLDETGKVPVKQLPYGSEGENSFSTNDSAVGLSNHTFATGKDTIAGCLGYYITAINTQDKKIYLCKEKVKSPELPALFTLDGEGADNADTSFGTPAYESGDVFTIINDLHYVLCATIKSISNNVVEYEGDLGFTTIVPDDAIYGHTFSVPSKPTVGEVGICIGDYAFATGQLNIAAGRRSFSSGLYNLSAGAYAYTEGNSNIAGYVGHGEGFSTEALGYYSHSENFKTKAKGRMSHSQNYMTVANGDASHAQNYLTKANGHYSSASGEETEANGVGSSSSGKKTKANGYYSSASGEATVADGVGSSAEGKNTCAKGIYAKAIGCGTKATKDMSFSLGYGTIANGSCSVAMGSTTEANGDASVAEGLSTIANGDRQHVFGINNAPDEKTIEYPNGKFALIVGNGTSPTNRSNIHTLDWEGNAWYKGDVYVGGTEQSEGDKLARVTEISNPNLLINGDFQVWQRGESFSLTSPQYCADRWYASTLDRNMTGSAEIISTDSGMQITLTGQASIYQIMENQLKIGEEYILSAKINGEIRTLQIIGGTATSNNYLVYGVTSPGGSPRYVGVRLLTGTTSIEWVKLEKGSIATPFVSRLYAEELLLCQRYYYVLPYGQYVLGVTTGNFYLHSDWVSNNMRDARTVTMESTDKIMFICSNGERSYANITGVQYADNAILLTTDISDTPYYNTAVYMWFAASDKICIDAEIY